MQYECVQEHNREKVEKKKETNRKLYVAILNEIVFDSCFSDQNQSFCRFIFLNLCLSLFRSTTLIGNVNGNHTSFFLFGFQLESQFMFSLRHDRRIHQKAGDFSPFVLKIINFHLTKEKYN